VAGGAVTAASHRKRKTLVARKSNDLRDIICVRDTNDHRRTSVETSVDDRARGVVIRVFRTDHATGE
jgi:hypothetical protein